MTREEIIRNLKYTMEKHKNDTVNTFDTNISVMCKDILDYFEEQEPCDKCVYSTKDGYCQYDDITETIPPLDPCDDCIFEEGSKYCIEHCPHEARVESYEDKQMNNISKNIARMFADFINSFEYDAYEIAMVCSQVLNENNVKFSCAKHSIGINIFTDTEMESEE